MSKFTKIIQNALGQLNETNADGTTAAGPYNGGVSTTAKDTSSTQETKPAGVSDPNNPLHSAFEKIKQNPENPALSNNEHDALQGLAKSLDDAKNSSDQESDEEKKDSNASGGQVQNTVVSGAETYSPSTPGITG
jgi:hypothetical protein